MEDAHKGLDSQSSELIVHIGFGKTSTSKLQVDIFPYLCEYTGYKYWGNESGAKFYFSDDIQLTDNFINLIARMWLDKPVNKMEFQRNTFISNEGLSSYRDAHRMLDYAEKNLTTFGRDAHIVLTIREPRRWLTSIYMQRCLHENPTQEPEHFFLSEEDYSVYLPDAKFNIDRFDYIKIIDKYRDLFEKITVVKFEALPEMNFLLDIFSLTEKQLIELRMRYKKRKINRALSISSIKLVKNFGKVLAQFQLSYKAKYNNAVLLSRSRYDYLKKHTLRNSEMRGLKGLRVKFFSIFHYKVLLFKIVDKIVPYNKFSLNFDDLKNINIKFLEQQYNSLPDYITYNKTDKQN